MFLFQRHGCATLFQMTPRIAPLTITISAFGALILCATAPEPTKAQAFVEYPGQNVTYGDHLITSSSWAGGPTTVTLTFDGDGTLHNDGLGSSQRTARNTLNFTSPYSATNPQNYDELIAISLYGTRLPLLQQMSASGTSTLTYAFATPVNDALDLFIADLDQSDFVQVRAFTANNALINMSLFVLADETDLSTFKDTGTVFSPIVAPPPVTTFSPTEISLSAVDDTNYNRSLSVLRSPPGIALERIEITFSGTRNSPDRASGGGASHVYVALATAAPEPGFALSIACGIASLTGFSRRRRLVSPQTPSLAAGA